MTIEPPPFLLPHACPTLLNSLPTSWQLANSAPWSARAIRFGLSGGEGLEFVLAEAVELGRVYRE